MSLVLKTHNEYGRAQGSCAAKLKTARNTILLNFGAAERNRLCLIPLQFIGMEDVMMQQKSKPATESAAHSSCMDKLE